jgi:hypothetical protein
MSGADMAVPGVLYACFAYGHPRHKHLPKLLEIDSTIPCEETLNRFILSVNRGGRKVTISTSLEEMIKCDLPRDSTKDDIKQRGEILEEMVERAINVELPMGTKQSAGSYSRRDRSIHTMTQCVIQAAAVEAFHIMWNVLIEPTTEKGGTYVKTEEEKKKDQRERKKFKQRSFDNEKFIGLRNEVEKQGESHIIKTEKRKQEFVESHEKGSNDIITKMKRKRSTEMSKFDKSQMSRADVDIEKNQLMLDSEFAKRFIDYIFPTEDCLLFLTTWNEISPVKNAFNSQREEQFPISMLMRFECANEICSTNAWTELRAVAVRCDSNNDRRHELSKVVELTGSKILTSWSKKYDKRHKANCFLSDAITLGLVSRCLRKLKISDEEEEIMSQIEINFEEGDRSNKNCTF